MQLISAMHSNMQIEEVRKCLPIYNVFCDVSTQAGLMVLNWIEYPGAVMWTSWVRSLPLLSTAIPNLAAWKLIVTSSLI